jgi:hypothetical protein
MATARQRFMCGLAAAPTAAEGNVRSRGDQRLGSPRQELKSNVTIGRDRGTSPLGEVPRGGKSFGDELDFTGRAE